MNIAVADFFLYLKIKTVKGNRFESIEAIQDAGDEVLCRDSCWSLPGRVPCVAESLEKVCGCPREVFRRILIVCDDIFDKYIYFKKIALLSGHTIYCRFLVDHLLVTLVLISGQRLWSIGSQVDVQVETPNEEGLCRQTMTTKLTEVRNTVFLFPKQIR